MRGYKGPTYQDRVERAAAAKQEALDRLKARPVVDEATLAARREAALAREAAQAEKRAAKQAARDQAESEKAARAAEAAPPSEAELKAARDARYAARKSRK